MSFILNNTYHSSEGVKSQRKKLEENAIKISCRLQLLQVEEQKANTIIKQTKDKQEKIIEARKYNEQLAQTKMD